MEARSKRTLKPGTEFDPLFDGFGSHTGSRIVARQAGIERTVEFVREVARKYRNQTAKIAPLLRGATLNDTCRNIWRFVYEHIQYRLDDPGHEQVRRPARSWFDRKRGVDCEDYSVFISTILLNLDIPHRLRIAAYKADWQHIYIVVPREGIPANSRLENRRDYYVIDPVMDGYDDEFPPTKIRDYAMPQLEELGSVPAVVPDIVTGASGLTFALRGLGTTDMFAFAGMGETPDMFAFSGLGAAPTHLGKPQIILTYPTKSGHTAGMDQYGQIYLADESLSGLGFFGKLFRKIKSGVDKVFTVANQIPFVKKLADTVGVKVLNAGLAVTTAGLVTNRTLKDGVNIASSILGPGGGGGGGEQQQQPPAVIDESNPVISNGSVGQPQAPVNVIPAGQQGPAAPMVLRAPEAGSNNGGGKDDKDKPWYTNPAVIVGGAAGVGALVFIASRSGSSGRSGGLSGTPRKRKKTATTGSKTGTKGHRHRTTPLK